MGHLVHSQKGGTAFRRKLRDFQVKIAVTIKEMVTGSLGLDGSLMKRMHEKRRSRETLETCTRCQIDSREEQEDWRRVDRVEQGVEGEFSEVEFPELLKARESFENEKHSRVLNVMELSRRKRNEN